MVNKKMIDKATQDLLDMIPFMVATHMMVKIASDLYKSNPRMFWDYQRYNNKDIIFNCRM